MFADSLCKENERGRQGWDACPRSLLVPLHALTLPRLAPLGQRCWGLSLLWPPWSPTASPVGQLPGIAHFWEPTVCLMVVSISAPPKFQHLQKVARLSCDRDCCCCRIAWPPESAGKLSQLYSRCDSSGQGRLLAATGLMVQLGLSPSWCSSNSGTGW